MLAELAVRGTIALATTAWAGAEWTRLALRNRWRTARVLWTAGAVLAATHMLAAFHYVHAWDHRAALAATARQTAALTGLDWGGGLYVNYAFVGLWLWDAAEWWRNPDKYARRTRKSRELLLAVFLFMFINGGIVFAQGPARALGCAAVGAVLWAFARHRPRR